MANNNKLELDAGFKEVALDPGFQEVGLDKGFEEVPLSNHTSAGDFATGVHRGSMLGGAEELAGLGSAIGEKAGDSDTFNKLVNWYQAQKTGASPEALAIANEAQLAPKRTFYENYRAGEKAAQAETDAARKASPWAYGAGQLTGGLATGIAASPLAAAAPMATAVGTGALTGGLESSSTIENPLGLAKDAAIGGTIGAVLQKVLPGSSKASSVPEKDILKRGEFLPQLETAAKMGEQGISFSSKPEARQALTQRLQQNEQGIAKKFIEPRKELGQAVGDSLQTGEGSVLTQSLDSIDAVKNVEEVLAANSKSLGRGKAEQLIQKAQDMQQGLLSPQEAYTFRKELDGIANKIADPEQQQIFKTGLDAIKGSLDESAPGFREASRDFAQFAEKGPEALLSKGHDPEIADVFLGDMNKGDLKISEKVRDLLGTIRGGGAEGLKKQGEFFSAMEQLKQLAETNPELVKKIGIDPAKLTREFIQKADEVAIAKKVSGEGIAQSAFERGRFGLRKASESGALKAANIYGQTKKFVHDFANSTGEQLKSAAEALRQHGGPDLQNMAESLASEIPQKRNAAIFTILQLPKAKQILNIGGEE